MEGANVYTALIAFAGGLASFLSPCVLPLVPGYLSFVTGLSGEQLAAARTSAPAGDVLVRTAPAPTARRSWKGWPAAAPARWR